jgi:threonyl-tRNA synthetase
VQVKLIPIADRHVEYAQSVAERLQAAGLRVEIDASSERMQAKIRDAQMEKIPYMLVIGDQEMEAGQVNLRKRDGQKPGAMSVDDFVAQAKQAVEEKQLL